MINRNKQKNVQKLYKFEDSAFDSIIKNN